MICLLRKCGSQDLHPLLPRPDAGWRVEHPPATVERRHRHARLAQHHTVTRRISRTLHRLDDGPSKLPRHAGSQLDVWRHVSLSRSSTIELLRSAALLSATRDPRSSLHSGPQVSRPGRRHGPAVSMRTRSIVRHGRPDTMACHSAERSILSPTHRSSNETTWKPIPSSPADWLEGTSSARSKPGLFMKFVAADRS